VALPHRVVLLSIPAVPLVRAPPGNAHDPHNDDQRTTNRGQRPNQGLSPNQQEQATAGQSHRLTSDGEAGSILDGVWEDKFP